jgi:hypothetical protein
MSRKEPEHFKRQKNFFEKYRREFLISFIVSLVILTIEAIQGIIHYTLSNVFQMQENWSYLWSFLIAVIILSLFIWELT